MAYKQAYTERQVQIEVDNWLSAIVRARDRVKASTEALRLAKTLEEGERARFNMGATSVLFVNLRERAVVEAAYELYRAQADYAVARGGMLWARGLIEAFGGQCAREVWQPRAICGFIRTQSSRT